VKACRMIEELTIDGLKYELTIDGLKYACKARCAVGFLIDLYGDATTVQYGSKHKHPLNAVLAIHQCSKTMLPVYVVSYEGFLPQNKADFLKRYRASRINRALCPESWEALITEANRNNLFVIGAWDACELKWIRNYKNFTLIADTFMFANYTKSEIEEKYKETMDLTKPYEKEVWEGRPKPSDKIPGIGITYEELEWADKNNRRTHILSVGDPAKDSKWFRYTGPQKRVLSKLYEVERSTRYKAHPDIRGY